MGFYHVNARARREHCDALGVDIGAFSTAFEQKFRALHGRAVAAVERQKLTEDKLWSVKRNQFVTMIKSDMGQIAQQSNGSDQDACRLVNQHAERVVDMLDFETQQPEAHGVLMSN